MTKTEYAAYEQSVADFIGREHIAYLSTGTEDLHDSNGNLRERDLEGDSPSPWFSWRPCKCCGSPLGGNREYLYARHARTGDLLQYEICTDCVYYITYGHLDDMTMLAIEA